jgi:hypothetical protein
LGSSGIHYPGAGYELGSVPRCGLPQPQSPSFPTSGTGRLGWLSAPLVGIHRRFIVRYYRRQYPASSPCFHTGRSRTPGSLGLAWGRVRGTRSWVYPPLSQGQRSSEVSEGILFAPTIGFAGLPSFVLQDLEHFIRRSSLPGKMVVGPGPAPLRFSQPYGCRAFSSRIHRSRAK